MTIYPNQSFFNGDNNRRIRQKICDRIDKLRESPELQGKQDVYIS